MTYVSFVYVAIKIQSVHDYISLPIELHAVRSKSPYVVQDLFINNAAMWRC